MILAIEPASVRMELAQTDYGGKLETPAQVFYRPAVFDPDGDGNDASKTGVFGDPCLATAEKGAKLLAMMRRNWLLALDQFESL